MKDCCAATCSGPFCGAGILTEAFGVTVNNPGDGFRDCKDPSMVPITIHVQDFVSSVEPRVIFSQLENQYCWKSFDADFRKNLTSWFGDLEEIRPNFIEFVTWMNENDPRGYPWSKEELSFLLSDPIAPLLSLYCDQKNVISIRMDKSMEDNSETVIVEDGAECTLEIENTTNWDESIWYFNYTIYYDSDLHGLIDEAIRIKIDDGSSFEEGPKQFIPKLSGSIPSGIGFLYELKSLSLGKHLFPVLLFHFETKQICIMVS